MEELTKLTIKKFIVKKLKEILIPIGLLIGIFIIFLIPSFILEFFVGFHFKEGVSGLMDRIVIAVIALLILAVISSILLAIFEWLEENWILAKFEARDELKELNKKTRRKKT